VKIYRQLLIKFKFDTFPVFLYRIGRIYLEGVIARVLFSYLISRIKIDMFFELLCISRGFNFCRTIWVKYSI